jgi:hypothetical protein
VEKRLYSKRHIQILALQRCSRAISLVVQNGLFEPHDFPMHGEKYPYGTELDLACNEIAFQLRKRLAELAEREFSYEPGTFPRDTDNLTL